MDSALAPEDLSCLVNEVSRFAQRTVAPKFDRYETLVSAEVLSGLMSEATGNGFLNSAEETGVSIWEQADDPLLLQFSCQALSELARINPGLAYLCHHTSLSYFMAKQLGVTFKAKDIPAIAIQGHYGLARHSLARYFVADLNSEDVGILKDYFSPDSGRDSLLQSVHDWTHIISPAIDKSGVIQFALLPQDKLMFERLENVHGLNEVSHYRWRKNPKMRAAKTSRLSREKSLKLLGQVLQMQWLGLISIAQGATGKGYQMAREYASMRVQGGKAIAHHPAVQQLLSQAKSAVKCSEGLVTTLCARPLSKDTLTELAQVRSQLHPLLCKGANNSLQVFGGMGYMQDTGLEKIVRDVAQLKLMNGTPTELLMFVAELESHQ